MFAVIRNINKNKIFYLSTRKYRAFSNNYLNNHIAIPQEKLLDELNYKTKEEFINDVYPKNKIYDINITSNSFEKIKQNLDKYSNLNTEFKNFYGTGFYNSYPINHLVQNFLLNPNFYSAYIPYQSEISQGRLELLYNYQTMICDLTNMDIANCSLLDESSACAEAMVSLYNFKNKKNTNPSIIIDDTIFPQHKEVLKTRAKFLNLNYEFLNLESYKKLHLDLEENTIAIFQTQDNNGNLIDIEHTINYLKSFNISSIVITDPLLCTIQEPPGTFDADMVIGSTQRFGLPLWNGGPHAAFFACKQKYLRVAPGRIVSKSKDAFNKPAYRLALQAREQHIKKDKALSNICTSQALLANYNVLYAMNKGPNELQNNALNIKNKTKTLKKVLKKYLNKEKYEIISSDTFDTIGVNIKNENIELKQQILLENNILVKMDKKSKLLIFNIDETTTFEDMEEFIKKVFFLKINKDVIKDTFNNIKNETIERKTPLMQQDIFHLYNNEHKMTRYLTNLQKKDISLTHSMIPLGSCTMKLNSTDVLSFLTDSKWKNVHPFTPLIYQKGYTKLIENMQYYLGEITGLPNISFQSNSGATGEYSALCAIKTFFKNKNEERDICIIPESAHGTNFASAILAGLKVKKIKSTKKGNICEEHLQELINKYNTNIACMMITFPSTYGFFEDQAENIISKVKETGAKIYCDGANMNSFMGLVNLKDIGIDACHMNLHKTFTIPHGGGGPGLGPIAVTDELKPFLPSHSIIPLKSFKKSYGSVASTPFSSASLLTIPYTYITLCGGDGLRDCSISALLASNYMKQKLESHFKIPFTNKNNMVSHEFIIDVSEFKPINEKDIAKRLMDFGFHAPTMSWPVSSSLMIEPTECESIEELDRFISALIQIKKEIEEIHKNGNFENNLLTNAPHSIDLLYEDDWKYDYSKKEAYFPLDYVKKNKFHIPVSRVDDTYGDRNLVVKD